MKAQILEDNLPEKSKVQLAVVTGVDQDGDDIMFIRIKSSKKVKRWINRHFECTDKDQDLEAFIVKVGAEKSVGTYEVTLKKLMKAAKKLLKSS